MLLGKDGGGHQIDYLLALLHGLKCCPDGNLRLAIPYIPADQAVHNLPALHIPLSGFNGKRLILRLFKGKQFLKFALPYGILPIAVPLCPLPYGIEFHQILGDFLHGAFDPLFGLGPFLAIQAVDFGALGICPGIFLEYLQLGRQHIEGAALVIFNFHIILGRLLDFYLFNPTVNTHAIAFMDDIVANAQIRKALDFLPLIDFAPFLFLRLRAKNIALRNHQKLDIRVFEALAQLAICHHHLPRL